MRSDWTWLELGNPRPKAQPSQYTPMSWPEGGQINLQRSGDERAPQLASVLATRRSRRDFAEPASPDDLAALFDLCCRTQTTSPSSMGFELDFRPHPSSGAIHSIHTLVQRASGDEWARYDPRSHKLVTLPQSAAMANAARCAASEVVDATHASLIAFVAEPGKSAAKYAFPESLVWRDAGVLLGYFSICAEALGLLFCPLGITGDPHLSTDLDQQGRLRGVGMALLGRLSFG